MLASPDLTTPTPAFILLTGATLLLVLLSRMLGKRIGVSLVIMYVLIGMLVGRVQAASNVMGDSGVSAFAALGELGVICLLFRVGLDSKIAHLFAQLRLAIPLWLSNVAISGGAGFLAAYAVLGQELLPSLVVGVALSATSVGVAVAIWKEADRLDTPAGTLMLDIAELDDLSAVLLLGLLLAIALPIATGSTNHLLSTALSATAAYALRLAGFAVVCVLLARIEPRLTHWVRQRSSSRAGMVIYILASALIIAGAAGMIGLPVAIGAFFAGLVFSRDRFAVRYEGAFEPLYAFFVPFFFIHIGMVLDPAVAFSAAGAGMVLAAAAILGKVGGALPAATVRPFSETLILGVSLVPRAEICLVIIKLGHKSGPWLVPDHTYAAMVTVVLVTCLIPPLILRHALGSSSAATNPDPDPVDTSSADDDAIGRESGPGSPGDR